MNIYHKRDYNGEIGERDRAVDPRGPTELRANPCYAYIKIVILTTNDFLAPARLNFFFFPLLFRLHQSYHPGWLSRPDLGAFMYILYSTTAQI